MRKSLLHEKLRDFVSGNSFFFTPMNKTRKKKNSINLTKWKTSKGILEKNGKTNNSVDFLTYKSNYDKKKQSPAILNFKSLQSATIKKQILKIQTPGNSMSSSLLSKELSNQKELKNDNTQINKLKKKIEENGKKIEDNNIKINQFQTELEELKKKKEETKIELANNISESESIEQIYNNILNDYTERGISNKNDDLTIYIEDITSTNKEKLKAQVKTFINEIEPGNKIDLVPINEGIDKAYNTFDRQIINTSLLPEEIVTCYLNSVSNKIFLSLTGGVLYKENILGFFKYILKINSVSENIERKINFIQKEYKSQKAEKKLLISDLTALNIQYENKKRNLEEAVKEIQEKERIQNMNRQLINSGLKYVSPKSIEAERNRINFNQSLGNKSKSNLQSHQYSLSQTSNFFKTIFDSGVYKESPKASTISFKGKKSHTSIQSPNKKNSKSISSTTYNTIRSSTPIITNNNSYSASSSPNLFTIKESFCYFKIFTKNEKPYNPLLHYTFTPEKFGYTKGFISIDYKANLLKIIQKDSEEFITIITDSIKKPQKTKNIFSEINQITQVSLRKFMQDVIRIHEIVMRNKERCGFDDIQTRLMNVTKLLNLKEIKTIKLEHNEKIKAALCQMFSFTISFEKNEKVDCIFINLEDFNFWYKGLKEIVTFGRGISQEKKFNKAVKKNLSVHYYSKNPFSQMKSFI